MNDVAEKRAVLASAIDGFKSAEAVYVAARDVAEAAAIAVHAALEQRSGPNLFPLVEARSRASLAPGEALDALAQANEKTITCANLIIEAAAGQAMRLAIGDVGNSDPIVVAWRDCRNALIKDSTAPLTNAAA